MSKGFRFSPTAFNCCIACSRLFLAVSSIIVATLTLCLLTVTLKEHHGVWRLRHLVTHLQLLNLLLLSSRPLKHPPRSLGFNNFSFSLFSFSSSSFFSFSSSSFFLIVSLLTPSSSLPFLGLILPCTPSMPNVQISSFLW